MVRKKIGKEFCIKNEPFRKDLKEMGKKDILKYLKIREFFLNKTFLNKGENYIKIF